MIERQGCWTLGIVDTKGIEATGIIVTHDIGSLMLTISVDWRDVMNRPPLTAHGNLADGRQEREGGITHLNDGKLVIGVLHRHQIAPVALSLITNKTVVAMLRQVIMEWTPSLK